MTKTFAVLALVISIPLAGTALASEHRASTFQETCSNLGYRAPDLTAECKTRIGATVFSSVALRGIENIDGTLRHSSGRKTGTFYKTCRDISVSKGGKAGARLMAECQRIDGSWVRSSTGIRGVDNIDGNLEYRFQEN
ncbi:CVNH domain-containing protein [Ruegeria sp. R13_0]|uniref:CVNH domain-containing protein n=1 Tax=Ruegeria sp. R13_0 TaxID=2821099 RepID=UPI001ADD4DD6|nr:CVNH domain-containing protein [Ruegeria sp. R13_0]MBO9436380.1 CVNH domain-containing protein [Ruegeria sp. R13_0]